MPDLARRFAENPLLQPAGFSPSRPDLKVECLLNPGAFRYDGKTWLLIRVAERPEQRDGKTSLPMSDGLGNVQILFGERRLHQRPSRGRRRPHDLRWSLRQRHLRGQLLHPGTLPNSGVIGDLDPSCVLVLRGCQPPSRGKKPRFHLLNLRVHHGKWRSSTRARARFFPCATCPWVRGPGNCLGSRLLVRAHPEVVSPGKAGRGQVECNFFKKCEFVSVKNANL